MSKKTKASSLPSTPEEIAALLKQLESVTKERDKLKVETDNPIGLKRHRFGALQITGIRNGFVGFYRDEWKAILDNSERIRDKLAELDPEGDDGVDVSDAILNKSDSYEIYAEEREASKPKK